jgi:pimeloyl-ACP methyl ester carboxylesterase
MKLFFLILSVLVLISSTGGQISSPSLSRKSVELQPCEVQGASPEKKEKVLCGTYEVFEDRARRSGRKVPIKIVVFPATGQNKASDPLFYIPGGPGSSATEDAPYVAGDFAKIRERRDLVFVDQRGTGGSNPLECTFFDPADPQSYLGYWNPLEAVRKCRSQLETKADLRLYTTSIAMDDLEDVRSALGYGLINMIGVSYGTRATQEFLKRHSEHVRTAILHGVSLTSQLMPRDFPQDTERALKDVIGECLADEACRTAFPDLRAEVASVREKLLRGPIETEVKYPPDGQGTRRVKLSRDLAAEAVRYMLYQPSSANRLPLYLHVASQGNFTPLAEAAIFFRQNIVASGGNGLYLSITCAEDLPWIKGGEGQADNTFLGDYRLRQQREACSVWPRSEIPKDYSAPTRSNVPTLILTGEWDPVTPPVYGETAARYLPNSLQIVVPSGGHGFAGLNGIGCLDGLLAEFIDRDSTRGLDTSCVKSIRRSGFALKLQ